jgi:hypothetical protein
MISFCPRVSPPATTLRRWNDETVNAVVVLAASGIGGFHAGMVTFPDWQVAVETAQVVAGIVRYPNDSPFYEYHLKLWTVLHQICALLLVSGVSEIALSKLLSGLLGMVSFQALAMIVYALGRDSLLAIGSAFLISFTRTAEYGVTYPIHLMGTTHTYGVLGLSTVALIVGLTAAGWYRTGGFLVGLAPAIHPSLGAWFGPAVVAAGIWHFRRNLSELRPALRFVFAGFAVTAVSLVAQLVQSRGIPTIDPVLAQRYLASFITFWDGHRQPPSLSAEGVKLTIGLALLAVLWLKLSPRLASPAALLLRMVVVTTTLSLVLLLVSLLPAAALPPILLVLMPSRLVNLNALIAVAVVIGLVANFAGTGQRTWSGLLMVYLTIGLFISNRSMLWELDDGAQRSAIRSIILDSPTRPLQIVLTVSVLLVVIAAVFRWRAACESVVRRQAPAVTPSVRVVTALARSGVLVTLAAATFLLWQWPQRSAREVYSDWTNNSSLAVVAAGSGLLLTGGDLHLVQLRTRRPVLLDGGGLDGLPYALESGPAFERILRDVYAIDLHNPPEEARGKGVIPNGVNQATWERFTPERWRQIRHAYHVTQVMTTPHWTLALPVAARDGTFTLYDIPE